MAGEQVPEAEGSTTVTGGADTPQGGSETVQGGQDTQAGGDAGQPTPEAKDKAEPDAKAAQAKVVPEKYDIKPPKGFESLDAATVAEFEPIAKKLKLSNEEAQELVNLQGAILTRMHKAGLEAETTKRADWLKSAQNDAEIGGAKLDAAVKTSQKAITAFATPEFKAFLDETHLGNHPEMIRFCNRVGLAISEDGRVSGSGSTVGKPKDAAELLYGNSSNK